MEKKQNLELKHFCPDFKPIRKVLKELGAQKEIVKQQKDYFFNLPKRTGVKPRLKMRFEGNEVLLVYYERPDFQKGKETAADIFLYEGDEGLQKLLERALGVSAVVEKKREVWRKGHTVFHLDIVKGVGNIFEIELQKKGKITESDRKLFASYQRALLPHLGKVIRGSNIDLVKSKS